MCNKCFVQLNVYLILSLPLYHASHYFTFINISIHDKGAFVLTPKGSACIFWQHRNFGHEHVTRDLHVLGWNFNIRWRQGMSFICTKFHDIWKYESKLWTNMSYFFPDGQPKQIRKNHFFHKEKFEIGFLELCIWRKL